MAECGTYGGYQRHKKSAEEACEPCKAANVEYHDGYRKRTAGKSDKRVGYASRKALADLRTLHPEQYHTLYEHHALAWEKMQESKS